MSDAEAMYDADVDSEEDPIGGLEQEHEDTAHLEDPPLDQEEPDPPDEQHVHLGASAVSDAQPSSSSGITAESFTDDDDEDPVRPPFTLRRSQRTRQPRKMLTYDRKGEPRIKRYPSHFVVQARLAPHLGSDTSSGDQ